MIADDATHWALVALLCWIGVCALVVLWWSWFVDRHRSERHDASLVECHCRLVDSPHDWELHKDWVA